MFDFTEVPLSYVELESLKGCDWARVRRLINDGHWIETHQGWDALGRYQKELESNKRVGAAVVIKCYRHLLVDEVGVTSPKALRAFQTKFRKFHATL